MVRIKDDKVVEATPEEIKAFDKLLSETYLDPNTGINWDFPSLSELVKVTMAYTNASNNNIVSGCSTCPSGSGCNSNATCIKQLTQEEINFINDEKAKLGRTDFAYTHEPFDVILERLHAPRA